MHRPHGRHRVRATRTADLQGQRQRGFHGSCNGSRSRQTSFDGNGRLASSPLPVATAAENLVEGEPTRGVEGLSIECRQSAAKELLVAAQHRRNGGGPREPGEFGGPGRNHGQGPAVGIEVGECTADAVVGVQRLQHLPAFDQDRQPFIAAALDATGR